MPLNRYVLHNFINKLYNSLLFKFKSVNYYSVFKPQEKHTVNIVTFRKSYVTKLFFNEPTFVPNNYWTYYLKVQL